MTYVRPKLLLASSATLFLITFAATCFTAFSSAESELATFVYLFLPYFYYPLGFIATALFVAGTVTWCKE